MRALFYAVVLTAVLVASVWYLNSIQQQHDTALRPDPLIPRSPMVVKSDPAPRSDVDPIDLESENRDALYETGMELLDLWHLPEAADVFETLVDKDPNNYQAYLRLVECYSDPIIGEERRAGECWEKARAAAPSSEIDTLWVSAFSALYLDGEPETAVERLSSLVGKRSENARYYLAAAHYINGDPSGAQRYLEDLLDGDQSLGRARELLVRCKVALGEYDTAVSLAKDLATIYPEEPYPYVLLSRTELVEGRVKQAVEFCNNALRLDDRYVPAIVARAHLYVAEGEEQAARVGFEKLLLFDDPMLASVAKEGIACIDFLYGRFDDGSEGLDEAIRLAMSAGSTRRGLLHAFQLVDYLCELGRTDAAEAVLDRWVSTHGMIPDHLGKLRIGISHGDVADVRNALERIRENEKWRWWMRSLALDFNDVQALTFIKESQFDKALEVLDSDDEDAPVGSRRAYLRGFALFQNGNAEDASDFFEAARFGFHSLVFPYHSDPILYVQSIFYLAEAALARGERNQAAGYYRDFLDLWGDAHWELQAVDRARVKLETLAADSTSG